MPVWEELDAAYAFLYSRSEVSCDLRLETIRLSGFGGGLFAQKHAEAVDHERHPDGSVTL